VLFSLPVCSVVPNGALNGDDNLTLFVAIRNSGPGPFTHLVHFELTSDTGLAGSGNGAISTGSSFNGMQVTLRPEHYGRTHRFSILADPDNAIVERDERNNSLTMTVTLPDRPTSARDVECTTP
jgi:hypothetical protein